MSQVREETGRARQDKGDIRMIYRALLGRLVEYGTIAQKGKTEREVRGGREEMLNVVGLRGTQEDILKVQSKVYGQCPKESVDGPALDQKNSLRILGI